MVFLKYSLNTATSHFRKYKAMRNQAPSDEESNGMQEHYTIQQQSGYSTMQIVFKLPALAPGCVTNSKLKY